MMTSVCLSVAARLIWAQYLFHVNKSLNPLLCQENRKISVNVTNKTRFKLLGPATPKQTVENVKTSEMRNNCLFGRQSSLVKMLLLCRNLHVHNLLLQIAQRKKGLLVFLSAAAVFNWERDGVSDAELSSSLSEMNALAEKGHMKTSSEEGWELFAHHKNLKIWRRYVHDSNLFEYRVLGAFNDITPRAFYETQMDVKFWRGWDPNTLNISILEESVPLNSQVIHWIYKYPYPMKARDYLYVRRGLVEESSNSIVVRARAVLHPKCPAVPSTVRVLQYQSCLVIRPHTTFDQVGLSFYMTYFDNPLSYIPSYCYNWMISSSVASFVERLHKAAKITQKRIDAVAKKSGEHIQ